jgi:hypothetical protein
MVTSPKGVAGRFLWLLPGILLLSSACQSMAPVAREHDPSEVVLTGPMTREQLEESLPQWIEAQMAATVHPEATRQLARVQGGARVRVFLGTWCSDSRREVSTLWRVMDENMGILPFEVEYYGVDRDTLRSDTLVAGFDLDFVPTIVVERDRIEVGRIVESAPEGLDRDLLALLEGKTQGVISGRPELSSKEPGAPED